GVIILISAIIDFRKKRGPRRKNPRGPKNERALVKELKKSARDQAPVKGRRKAKKTALMAAAVTTSVALLTGCSSSYWPKFPEPTETSSQTQETESPNPDAVELQPGLSVLQFERVIGRISASIQAADEAKDIELAKERVGGGALQVRDVAYRLAKADSNFVLPAGVDPSSV